MPKVARGVWVSVWSTRVLNPSGVELKVNEPFAAADTVICRDALRPETSSRARDEPL